MRWLRTVGALLAIAVLFAIGWNFYMWLHRQDDRSVQSAPLPEGRMKPAGRTIPPGDRP
jgi:uncharacterized iron-regulated membrane protein